MSKTFETSVLKLLDSLVKSKIDVFDYHGLERESFRVNAKAEMMTTPHPEQFGNKLYHPYITTDFSESQLELVTPPLPSEDEAYIFLKNLMGYSMKSLPKGEFLWSFSMPPILNTSVPLADYGDTPQGKIKYLYRKGLLNRYGSHMQAISGIHYNFSFSNAFWSAYFGQSFQPSDITNAYFALMRNFKRYGWLMILLFGASPVAHDSFYASDGSNSLLSFRDELLFSEAISLRNSRLGYYSAYQGASPFSYNDLPSYLKSLSDALSKEVLDFSLFSVPEGQLSRNLLQIENELYSDIRPKAIVDGKRPITALAQKGIEYLEIRNIDIDPFDITGISQNTLYFMKVFLWFCLLKDSPSLDQSTLTQLNQKSLQISEMGQNQTVFQEKVEEGRDILHSCLYLAKALSTISEVGSVNLVESVEIQLDKLSSGENFMCRRLLEEQQLFASDEHFYMHAIQSYKKLLDNSVCDKNLLKLIESKTVHSREMYQKYLIDPMVDFDEYFNNYMRI